MAAAASDSLNLGCAAAVDVGDLPVLLRRDQSGVVSAWLNICAHRSAPVFAGEARPCDRFRCPYHGWTYGPDGRLIRSPMFGGDPGDQSLTRLEVREAFGAIWVADSLEPSFGTVFAGLMAAGAPEAKDWHARREVSHALACSWDVYVENYLEAYHIPFIHPGLSRDLDVSAYQVEVHDGFVVHRVPPEPDSVVAGFWAWVWPNTMLNVYGSGMNIERVRPAGDGKCVIDYTYIFDPGASDDAVERAVAQSGEVTAEDRDICERVQRNLETGRAKQGPLSPVHEQGIVAFRAWQSGQV